MSLWSQRHSEGWTSLQWCVHCHANNDAKGRPGVWQLLIVWFFFHFYLYDISDVRWHHRNRKLTFSLSVCSSSAAWMRTKKKTNAGKQNVTKRRSETQEETNMFQLWTWKSGLITVILINLLIIFSINQ